MPQSALRNNRAGQQRERCLFAVKRKLSHYPPDFGTCVTFCEAGMLLLCWFKRGRALVATNLSKGEVAQAGLFL